MTDDRETELPLSYNQEFLCLFDQGNEAGPFGPRYNIVHASRVYGGIDVETLRLALDDLVVRHEVLRTTVVRDGEEKRQRIHAPTSPTLIVRDLTDTGAESRDVAAERFVIDIDASGHSVTTLPHLHAYGGTGYDFILTDFAERLRQAGLDQAEIDTLLIDNPRVALAT